MWVSKTPKQDRYQCTTQHLERERVYSIHLSIHILIYYLLIHLFTYRSFDYCEKERMCYLYEQRTIDMPPELINHTVPDCSHYTRKTYVYAVIIVFLYLLIQKLISVFWYFSFIIVCLLKNV